MKAKVDKNGNSYFSLGGDRYDDVRIFIDGDTIDISRWNKRAGWYDPEAGIHLDEGQSAKLRELLSAKPTPRARRR